MELKQGDCLELMKELENESIDCIITDPPYFLPAVHYQTRKQFKRNLVDFGILDTFFREVFKEFGRILKMEGTAYIFCDGQSYPLFWWNLYPISKSVRPLIWDKKTSINGYSWRHQHELIAFMERPEAKPVPSGDGDILRFNAVKVDTRIHPAEKPVELLETLIRKSTKEGQKILDPFMGCGSTGIACRNLNREFIGFELSPEYFKIAEEHLQDTSTQKQLAEIPPPLKSGGFLSVS